MEQRRFLRADEAAKYLGLSKQTLAKWRISGSPIPFVKIGARAIGYSVDDLEKYLASRKFVSTSQRDPEPAGV